MRGFFVLLALMVAIHAGQSAVLWQPNPTVPRIGLFTALSRFFNALVTEDTVDEVRDIVSNEVNGIGHDQNLQDQKKKCLKSFGEENLLLLVLCIQRVHTQERKMDGFTYDHHRGIF